MGNFPLTLHYTEAAKLVAVHNRTLLRHLKIADAGITPIVTVEALTRAFGIEESFLTDYFAGRDRAITTGEALTALGMEYRQRHILWGGLHTPIAIWGEYGNAARRYSARDLGMMLHIEVTVLKGEAAFRRSLGFSAGVSA